MLKDVRVLLLDDHTHMRKIMRQVLGGFGIRDIHEAGSVEQAFEILNEKTVDIAFVDYLLDGKDGAGFTRELRMDDHSPDPYLPVIMVSAHSAEVRIRNAINAGIDEFLVKPIRAKDVVDRINAVTHKRRPFVRLNDYFGPDRRRRVDPKYKGPWRRYTDEGYVDPEAGAFELD